MKNSHTSYKQKGYTLAELSIAIIFIAIMSAIGYATYASITANTDRAQLKSAIFGVLTHSKNSKNQYGDFNGFSNTTVYNSKKMIPSSFKSATTDRFETMYSTNGLTWAATDGATTIEGTVLSGTDKFLMTTINDVAADDCSDIVDDYIGGVLELRVGGSRVTGQSTRDSLCAAASSTVDIAFITN